MNKVEFISRLKSRYDIEIELYNKQYFLQPHSQSENGIYKFILYSCDDYKISEELLTGTMSEILEYKFENQYTLNKNFELFDVGKFTLLSFKFYMNQGGEIEFRLNKKQYFLQPYSRNKEGICEFILYFCDDSENSKELAHGTMSEILEYKFENKYTLNKDFEMFNIDYIL